MAFPAPPLEPDPVPSTPRHLACVGCEFQIVCWVDQDGNATPTVPDVCPACGSGLEPVAAPPGG